MNEIKVNLSDEWHRRAKAQAAQAGISLKKYAEEAVMTAVKRQILAALKDAGAAEREKEPKA